MLGTAQTCLACCIVFAAASQFPAYGGLVTPAKQRAEPLTSLPVEWRIDTQAPTLLDLIAQTKPTLHFDVGSSRTMFLWAETSDSSRRSFQLATAVQYKLRGDKREWILTQMDGGLLEDAGTEILPRTTIAVRRNRSPQGLSMGTENWARVVATDPGHGTLYEIEYYFRTAAEAALGHRLLIMQDTAGRWRLVASVDGNYWDDTGWETETEVEARWTGQPKTPLQLTVSRRGGFLELHNGKNKGVLRCDEFVYAGSLPFTKPVSLRHFIEVRHGQTFNWLIQQIVCEDSLGVEEDTRSRAAESVRASVLRMNRGLNIDQLKAGQMIQFPDLETRETMIKQAGRSSAGRPSD